MGQALVRPAPAGARPEGVAAVRFYVAGVVHDGVELDEERLDFYAETLETLRKWHSEGIVESYEFFADRMGGIAIFVTEDIEELQSLLDTLPLVGEDGFTLHVSELVEVKSDHTVHDVVSQQLGQ